MAISQNGWLASPTPSTMAVKPLLVAGVNAGAPGVAHHDYADVVLGYVATQYHYRVEKLRPGWNWGFFYRTIRGATTGLSNHSSATAIDLNAPLHPLGRPVSVNFSAKQVDEIHKILAEVDSLGGGKDVVRWGGDYTGRKDAMHFELNGSTATITRAGKAIIAGGGVKTKIGTKVVVVVKPTPSAKRIPGAVGAGVVNPAALFTGNDAPHDIADVQRVLNAWYHPHGDEDPTALEVDGVYGPATDRELATAAVKFGLKYDGSVAVKGAVLKKLGFKIATK